jgi:hypothetical protein
MDKQHKPESFGTFKPVNHVVVAFPDEADLQAAVRALSDAGIAAQDLARYSPDEMQRQAEHDIANASPLASVGQELNLVKAHRELAAQGHWFLVVPCDRDEVNVPVITKIAREHHATRAQRYGSLMIEELLDVGDGLPQTSESPDSGLDAQTRTGRESPRGPGR